MAIRGTVNPIWNLFDAASRRLNVRLSCGRCSRAEIYHAAALWKLFQRYRWDDDLRSVSRRFYCPACKRERGAKVKPELALVDEDHTVSLPLPDQTEWKRAISRRR